MSSTQQKVPDLISIKECQQILQKKFGRETVVLNFKLQQSAGRNCTFLTNTLFLEIKAKQNKQEHTFTFFMKCLPPQHLMDYFRIDASILSKERQFYMHYLQQLKSLSIDVLDFVTPTLLFSNETSLVFEDLKAEGFSVYNPRKVFPINYIKAALTVVSKLHASSLILEEKTSQPLTEQFETELEEILYGVSQREKLESFKPGIEALIDLTHDENLPISKNSFKASALQAVDLQHVYAAPSTDFRNTICHGAPEANNWLFRSKKKFDCKLVNFQVYRYAPPAQDVMALLYFNTDRSFRENHMEEMFKFYYQELNNNLGPFGLQNVISKDEFYNSCKYYKRFALVQTLMVFQEVLLPDTILDSIRIMPEDEALAILKDKYNLVTTTCAKDQEYKGMLTARLEELRKTYETP